MEESRIIHNLVISTKEKSPLVARQRLEIHFMEFLARISPYVEMTKNAREKKTQL